MIWLCPKIIGKTKKTTTIGMSPDIPTARRLRLVRSSLWKKIHHWAVRICDCYVYSQKKCFRRMFFQKKAISDHSDLIQDLRRELIQYVHQVSWAISEASVLMGHLNSTTSRNQWPPHLDVPVLCYSGFCFGFLNQRQFTNGPSPILPSPVLLWHVGKWFILGITQINGWIVAIPTEKSTCARSYTPVGWSIFPVGWLIFPHQLIESYPT